MSSTRSPGRSAHHGAKRRSIVSASGERGTSTRSSTVKRRSGEPCLAENIGERLALGDSAHGEIERRARHRRRRRRAPFDVAPFLEMTQQPKRFVARVVGAVTEHEIVRREELRERRNCLVAAARALQIAPRDPPLSAWSTSSGAHDTRCAIIRPVLGAMLRVLVVGLVVLVAAMFLLPRPSSAPLKSATLLQEPLALPPVALVDAAGKPARPRSVSRQIHACCSSASRTAPTSAR